MSEVTIQDKFKLYIQLNKELVEFRKKQKDQKKILTKLEEDIQAYMTENGMDSINIKDGDIVIYQKKVNQAFKRPAMIECLKDKLNCNDDKAEKLVESILTNKVFTVEAKIKATIKK